MVKLEGTRQKVALAEGLRTAVLARLAAAEAALPTVPEPDRATIAEALTAARAALESEPSAHQWHVFHANPLGPLTPALRGYDQLRALVLAVAAGKPYERPDAHPGMRHHTP